MAHRYLTDRKQRKTLAAAQLNPAGWSWALRAAYYQRLQALYRIRLLGTRHAPRFLLTKRTPNKHGKCWSDVSFRWPARNKLAGWSVPLFLGSLPSYTKSAKISFHTSCRRLLTESIQKITLGLQKPSVPKIVERQNTRAGNVCTWSSGECNMWLVSRQHPWILHTGQRLTDANSLQQNK